MADEAAPEGREDGSMEAGGRKLALLFPGQGSQHLGMGKRLQELSLAARRVFAQADEVVGFPLSRLCFEGPREALDDTVNTQPAIVATSVAYLANLRERLQAAGRHLAPSLVAGHSLGQFSAATASGALDFGEALRLVLARGRIMKDWARRRPGGLATLLGLDDGATEEVCTQASSEGEVGISARNAPGHTVIAGEIPALERAMVLAREKGARVIRLPISVPGHIPMMREAAAELGRVLANAPFRDPEVPIVSNITALPLTRAEDVRQELSDQLCSAVQWARCLVTMANQKIAAFVEVGPGATLSGIARRVNKDIPVYTLGEDDPPDFLLPKAPAGVERVP
jgi:[acyl-carrier-protein] S-malonyltransferase